MKEDGVVGFVPSPVNLETILIRREVQARKAAKALARYASFFFFSFPLTNPDDSLDWLSALGKKETRSTLCNVEAHVVV